MLEDHPAVTVDLPAQQSANAPWPHGYPDGYAVVDVETKYKAKNFNDTFVYRVGDQVGAWSYTFMSWLGIGLSGLAFTMVPLSAVWFALALWLGRKQVAYHRKGLYQATSCVSVGSELTVAPSENP
jgi:hypothetical protein